MDTEPALVHWNGRRRKSFGDRLNEVEDNDYQPENIVFYGEEIGGPGAFEDSQNEVVVSPLDVPFQDEIQNYVYQNINPNAVSQENRIDIYSICLHFSMLYRN